MPSTDGAIDTAISVMAGFAERTGIRRQGSQRYLWTDAFAVCNYLYLARVTGERSYLDLALELVELVHRVLGRYRDDAPQKGWISGLSDREGEAHPTRGGLRIGKKLPERSPQEPFDERLEWDRDGQYFHYLTKWMHALDQVAHATGDARYNLWARELAEVAHRSFAYGPQQPGARRMTWKMSTDLSRALVPAMGQHDPLDGFLTCIQLETTAAILSSSNEGPDLKKAASDFAGMLAVLDLRTVDPLGLGGLLADAARVVRLTAHGALDSGQLLLESLLAAAQQGVARYARLGELHEPATRRIAFRELGLTIGLRALELIEQELRKHPHLLSVGASALERLSALAPYQALGAAIESFWLEPEHRRVQSWLEHREINEVMLATSAVPEGYLVILGADHSPARHSPMR